MAFTLDPQTGKITFGLVADLTHDAIARDIASAFGVSETFNDDFTTDNWVDNGTQVAVNTSTGVIDWDANRQPGAQVTVFDLGAGNVSNTNWVLRFKLNINTYTRGINDPEEIIGIGISDSDQTESGNDLQDFLGMTLHISDIPSPASLLTIGFADNQAIPTSADPTRFTDHSVEPAVGTFYVEIKRTSATSLEGNLYSDADFTVLLSNVSLTVPSTVDTLRFLKVMNFGDNVALDHVLNGTLDDIQFWNGITVPVITSSNWRMRFELDITAISVPSANDLSMWIGMSDKDETNASTVANDSFQLSVFFDSIANSFAMQTADNQPPRSATTDVVMATIPSVNTFFIEMRRDSLSQTTVIFYTDNTFTTISETKTQAGISGTDNLKYLRLHNDQPGNNANTVTGTFDNFTFDDLTMVGDATLKPFIVDAILVVSVFTCGTKVIFQDDFSTAVNWTQFNTGTSVTGGVIAGWGADATDRRVVHDLVTPLSDKSWTAEFEFEFSAFANPAHDVFVVTNTNTDSGTVQDHIAMRFGFSGGLIQFGILHGGNSTLGSGTILGTTASINTRYFCRLQRISTNLARLTVFTGGFDSVLFGTIDVDLTLFGGPPTGLRFISSQASTLGGAGRTLTGIIDNLVVTNACCNFETDSELVEVSPTWSYREHELNTNPTFRPRATFGVEVASPNRFETATGPPSNGVSNNYIFKTFKKSDITGSTIDIIWEKTGPGGLTSNTFRVVDGSYDKDSLTDFVPGASGPTGKGAGVLGSFSSFPNHAEETRTLTGINWGASILPDVTVFAFITDTNAGGSAFDSLFVKEFNIRGTDNGENFKWEFLSPVVTAETTGTDQDAGYVNASLAVKSVTKSLCGIDLTDLKAYWNYDELSGVLVNQATAIGSIDSLGTSADGTVGSLIDRQQVGQVSDSYQFQGLTESQVGNRIAIGSSTTQFNFMHATGSVGTFNFWINPRDNTQNFADLFINENNSSSNRGMQIAIQSGKITVRPRNFAELLTPVTTTATLTPNIFNMVTVVWDEAVGADIYFNGVFIESFARTASLGVSTADFPLTIATRSQTQAGVTFDGFLDETTAWSRKLTAEEISRLFTLGIAGNPIQTGGASCVTVDALLQLQGANGVCSATYIDAMNTQTGWLSTDDVLPVGFMRIISGGLDWNAVADATNDTIATDLTQVSRLSGLLSDTDFRVRFKVVYGNVGVLGFFNHVHFYVGSGDQTINAGTGVEDAIGIRAQIGPTGQIVNVFFKDGTTVRQFPTGISTSLHGLTTGTFFYEIIRSGNSVTFSVYSDALFTTLINSQTGTIPATVTGLKFFKTGNFQFGNNVNLLTGTLDDLEIINTGATGSVACAEVDALLQSQANCGTETVLFDTINDATPWTVVGGSQIVVNDTLGIIEWNALQGGGTTTNRRATRAIPSFADNSGRIEMRVKVDKITSTTETGIFMQLQSGTGDPSFVSGSKFLIAIDAPPQGIFATANDGTTNINTSPAIPFADGTTRFLQLVIDPIAQTMTIAVYTDSAFTIHAPSSPQVVDISSLTLTGATTLDTIVTGNFTNSGTTRVITADLDDFTVFTGGCPSFTIDATVVDRFTEDFFVDALLKKFGVNICSSQQVIFSQSSGFDTNWITVGNGSVSPVFGGASVSFAPNTDNINDATARDLSDPSALGQLVSDTEFELVYSVTFQGLTNGSVPFINGNAIMIGLSSQDQNTNFQTGGTDDALFVRVLNQQFPSSGPTQLPRWQLYYKDGAGLVFIAQSLDNPNDNPILGTQFVKMERLSATTARLRVATDSLFTNIRYDTGVVVIPSTIGGLRYIKCTDIKFFNSQPAQVNGFFDNITLTTIPSNDCLQVDAIVKAFNTNKEFLVDGIAFVPPAKLFLIDGIILGTIDKTFEVDACLQNSPFFTFEVDACIQQNNNDENFTVDALVFILPVRAFLVDAIVRYAQGTSLTGGIPDLIIRVLRENPPSLKGTEIVDEIVKITSDPAEGFSFRGKTSRIKNWLNRLLLDGLILNDNSSPDWYRTNWSLAPGI